MLLTITLKRNNDEVYLICILIYSLDYKYKTKEVNAVLLNIVKSYVSIVTIDNVSESFLIYYRSGCIILLLDN